MRDVYKRQDLCPGELITWFLDLIVFDLARLDADGFHRVAGRANRAFATFLGTEWADMQMCIRDSCWQAPHAP